MFTQDLRDSFIAVSCILFVLKHSLRHLKPSSAHLPPPAVLRAVQTKGRESSCPERFIA